MTAISAPAGNPPERAFRAFEPDIRKAVSQTMGSGLDAAGNDRDDYAQDLRVTAWRAAVKFPGPIEERPAYVRRAIWNRAKSLRRNHARRVSTEVHPPRPDQFYDPSRAYEARVELRTLSRELRARERSAFFWTVARECGMPHQPQMGKPKATYHLHLQLMRKAAKKVLRA